MYNTPATYTWYMVGLVLQWLKQQGGLTQIAELNRQKADKLYQFIDDQPFYHNPIQERFRSTMNIPFTLANDDLNAPFLAQAEEAGLCNLKGHRTVGGMRASLYNAMPMEGVDALISFMDDFARNNQ